MSKRQRFIDPWAEYGKPITFIGAVLEPDPAPEVKPSTTLSELERILEREDELMIEILPNGSIATREMTDEERGNRKPLTMHKNLGGEYGR